MNVVGFNNCLSVNVIRLGNVIPPLSDEIFYTRDGEEFLTADDEQFIVKL